MQYDAFGSLWGKVSKMLIFIYLFFYLFINYPINHPEIDYLFAVYVCIFISSLQASSARSSLAEFVPVCPTRSRISAPPVCISPFSRCAN